MRHDTTLSLMHWDRSSREARKFAESKLAELERRGPAFRVGRSPITAPTGRLFRFLSRVPLMPHVPAHLVVAALVLGGIGCLLFARYH